jgi:WD40 repeat protein
MVPGYAGPPLPGSDPGEHERRIDEAIAAFHMAEEQGEAPDPSEWIQVYPDLAPELEQYFRDNDLIGAIWGSNRFGRFRLLKQLGRSSMGRVYEAEDPQADRPVALKVLPPQSLADSRSVRRFDRECEIVSELHHPNIVPLLESGRHESMPYYLMPLVDGRSLRAVLQILRRAQGSGQQPALSVAPPEAPDDPAPLVGTDKPWRAIARIGLQVARALDYAHQKEVIHRDIKPSNILLDQRGIVFVTDFGVARRTGQADLTESSELVGTLRFAAPERLRGVGDWRSDIYSLGLVLYELLTLKPVFNAITRELLVHAILNHAPRRPRSINRSIPRSLEGIVLRAIEPEPGHRYPSARLLAEDLERFLAGRQILSRRVSTLRRTWAWARRHKLRALVGLTASLAPLLGLSGLAWAFYLRGDAATARAQVAQVERDAATARARVAQVERDAAEAARRESQYRSWLLEVERARAAPRSDGWSGRAEAFIAEAAKIRVDGALREQAAATLIGLDAHLAKAFRDFGASSLAFSRDGQKLLMGGLDPGRGRERRAKLWDSASGSPQILGRPGSGPVAFRDDATPLQLTVDAGREPVLWDLARDEAATRFNLPGDAKPLDLALAPDGSLAAVSLGGTDAAVVIYDGRSGDQLHRFPGASTAMAFSPDGRLFATGNGEGRIFVRSLTTGETVAEFPQQRVMIRALAFAVDPLRGTGSERNWLLAAGGSAGSLAIWDVGAKVQRCICYGSEIAFYALAFAPGGSILASSGRERTTLWDAATGQLLLNLGRGPATSLAFHPNGRQLAIGSDQPLFAADQVNLWEVENGRGIQTLRGLSSPPSFAFSPKRDLVAALSADFRLATWELLGGRLLHVRETVQGMKGVNSGIVFSGDGRRLAVLAGPVFQLRDVDSGRDIRTWTLPPAVMDLVAFHPSGKLIVARAETLHGRRTPVGNDDPNDPTVFKLRLCTEAGDMQRATEVIRLTGNLHYVGIGPDGSYFVLRGSEKDGLGEHWWVKVFDGLTGEEVWSRVTPEDDFWTTCLDPTGTLLSIASRKTQRTELVEMRSGRTLRTLDSPVDILGPGGSFWLIADATLSRGRSLWGIGSGHLVNLGIDNIRGRGWAKFSYDGRNVAWGDEGGALHVAEIATVLLGLEKLRSSDAKSAQVDTSLSSASRN